jgi:DNA-binding IclR family transcriptional regulator
VKNKPAYSIESVDHALHLAQLLQQHGAMRVSDAAERLGVARSTAHRLLAMLVYRDFAEQDAERRYRPGPVLRPAMTTPEPATQLRRIALPHLEVLVAQVRETVNLQARVGTQIRFVASVECDQVLRVGDRAGRILPAHHASGGKALLATLDDAELRELYDADDDINLARLKRELSLVRKRGFAVNEQETEKGVSAIGMAVRDAGMTPVAALSLSLPSARFDRDKVPAWVRAMSAAVLAIEHDLAGEQPR